ncbi:hypothetical protein B0H19DRAFT_1068638 [Mycena capillaripes]|nr:hypothetical protein B0H19DRAFT_1068638 [Mycena capillaripes]
MLLSLVLVTGEVCTQGLQQYHFYDYGSSPSSNGGSDSAEESRHPGRTSFSSSNHISRSPCMDVAQSFENMAFRSPSWGTESLPRDGPSTQRVEGVGAELGLGPPRTASAPPVEPRPPRARTPRPDVFRVARAPAHAIAFVVLEPHCIRGVYAAYPSTPVVLLRPSAGPIIGGGRFEGLLASGARVRARASDTQAHDPPIQQRRMRAALGRVPSPPLSINCTTVFIQSRCFKAGMIHTNDSGSGYFARPALPHNSSVTSGQIATCGASFTINSTRRQSHNEGHILEIPRAPPNVHLKF